jgi:IS30 family transposase
LLFDDNAMTTEKSHLTERERCQIEVLRQEGFGVRAVARALGRDASVISRELKRNTPPRGGYAASAAQGLAASRREAQGGPRKESAAVVETISRGLGAGWSPEQISRHHRLGGGEFPSHQWIYDYIVRDRERGGQLYKKLWRKRKRGRKRNRGKKASCQGIPDRVPIGERPEVVARRERYGDWESDLIEGKGGGYLVTCVERKSRFTVIGKVPTKQAAVVARAETWMLAPFKVLTITRDNGLEFARHGEVNANLGCESYFCEPYHSWERGLVENRNGLVRRYLPKGTSFEGVGRGRLDGIEIILNNRPHEVLGWQSPLDMLDEIML